MPDPTKSESQPVTVIVSRKIVAGREQEYEDWISGMSQVAANYPGHMGVNILRPSGSTRGEYVTIYRFDSYQHACAWERSAERAEWIEKVKPMVVGEASRKKVTGLEFWFDLPSVPVTMVPTKHKMAVVLFVIVYSFVLLLSTLFAPLIGAWPLWAKLLVVIPLQVLLMTYIVMPRVTALLKNWLYKPVSQAN